MSARRQSPLLDHLADPEPEGFDRVVELFYAAFNAKANGKPRKREVRSRAWVRAALLGESVLPEDDRVLLDVAKMQARLRVKAKVLQHRIQHDKDWQRLSWIAPK